MSQDLLARLSDVELPTTPPDLTSVQRRAAHLRRARHVRRAAATALVGAAGVTALVVGPTLPVPGGGAPPSSAEAVAVMERAGAAAGRQPAHGEAAYWHVVTEYVASDLDDAGTQHREIWLGNHRPTVIVDTGVDDGAVLTVGEGTWFLAEDWSGFATLPTDPDELERAIRAELSPDGVDDLDQQMFETVRGMLVETPAPPPVRKALWEVLARVPGISSLGPVTDSTGRPGVALARDGVTLVVDEGTGVLLEQVSTIGPSEAAPDGIRYRSTLVEEGPADVAPGS